MERSKPFSVLLFFTLRYLISVLTYLPYALLYKNLGIWTYISFGHRNYSIRSTKIGKFVDVWGGTTFWLGSNISIGDYSQINPGAFVSGHVTIGKNALIGPGVKIIGGTHNFSRLDVPMRFQGSVILPIVIEDDVWIGANAVILGGCTLGRGSIIAAGAVVSKDVGEFSIVGGVPAKVLRNRKNVNN